MILNLLCFVPQPNLRAFRNLPVPTVIPQLINRRFQVGEKKVLSEFRQWVKAQTSQIGI